MHYRFSNPTTTAIKNILTPEQEQACYDFHHTYTAWCHSIQEQPNCKPLHITFVAMEVAIKHYNKVWGLNEKTPFEDVIKHYQNKLTPTT